MKRYRMSLVPESALKGRSGLTKDTPGPTIRSNGSRDYLCAACGKTLLRKVDRAQIQNVVFRCACGALNEIPRAHQTD